MARILHFPSGSNTRAKLDKITNQPQLSTRLSYYLQYKRKMRIQGQVASDLNLTITAKIEYLSHSINSALGGAR